MKGIVWLASYPRSGNTWLRVFLTNLQRQGEARASINDLDYVSGAGARAHFDEAVGYKAGDLTHEEVDRLRPGVYEYESRLRDETFYCKVHDAFVTLPDGRPLFPPQASLRAVYLVRNPFDVCVSFAHYLGLADLDAMIGSMADGGFALAHCSRDLSPQLRQRLLTWSDHVRSWVDGSRMPVHVMRYEDMRLSPLETFTACAAFLGLPHEPERVGRALGRSSFDVLRQEEKDEGFREAPSPRAFFREGRVGSWRGRLSPRQADRLVRDHRDVMRRFGYLTDSDEPVY